MNNSSKKPAKVDLIEHARQMRLMAEKLEREAKMARGTKTDLKKPAAVMQLSKGPYWTGDEGPTDELMATIWRMLLDRPWSFRQIVDATGAGENRIKGVIMRLQREGKRVVNVGEPQKALWWSPTDEAMKRLVATKRATAKR